jgi:cytochrome P450
VLKFDPYSREYTEDPYPIYARLRDEAPVFQNQDMNFWALSRYDDVVNAHFDAQTFSSAGGTTIEGYEAAFPLLIVKDLPEHRWAKMLVTKMFSRARIAELDVFIRERAVQLLEDLYQAHGADGEFDIFNKFTVQLPLYVISELLGIPEDRRDEVHHLSNQMSYRGEDIDPAETMAAQQKLTELYIELARDRRANPRDDVISMLIAQEVQDEDGNLHRMSDEEIGMRFLELGFAGHETVAKGIPTGMICFHQFPDQWARLKNDPSLMESAIEEILRFDPPSQLQGRTTTKDVHLHGVTIPKGEKVMLLTASATRDPRKFEDADAFDIRRKADVKSIYFGYGVHKCLGIHLARRELTIAFEELMARFPDHSVDPSRAKRPILSNVRGVSSLPARLGAHA